MATTKTKRASKFQTRLRIRDYKAPARKVSKKVSKKASAKSKKASAKSAIDLNRKIKGYAGLDEKFYKKFPRYAAYQILCSARNRTMTVGAFLEKIEALENVENRKQALGIVHKLVDKKRHVGAACASFVK